MELVTQKYQPKLQRRALLKKVAYYGTVPNADADKGEGFKNSENLVDILYEWGPLCCNRPNSYTR